MDAFNAGDPTAHLELLRWEVSWQAARALHDLETAKALVCWTFGRRLNTSPNVLFV